MPPPIAYLIQSHRGPDQLLRLVRTLREGSPESIVHISHDERGEPLDVAALEAFGNVSVRYHEGGYGDFSHVRLYLDAVSWLRDTGQEPEWVINLSGQDYPLRPIADMETELAASDADGFLLYFDVMGPDCHWPAHRGPSRYLYRHWRLAALSQHRARQLRFLQVVNRLQPLLRVHVAYGLTLGVRRRSIFGPDFGLYGGSFWMSLRWRAARYLLERAESDRRLVAQFEHALAPDEAFAHTVLVNAARFRLVNDARRYFDFRDTELNHPKTLTRADLPRALASGADFGRKFDMAADPGILDELDRVVLGDAGS